MSSTDDTPQAELEVYEARERTSSRARSVPARAPRRRGVPLLVLVGAVVAALALGGFGAIKAAPLLSFGSWSESTNTQVVRSIELKQDVILLSLSVDAIAIQEAGSHIGSWRIPGTSETVLMRYGFDAKLGVDGSQVAIEQTGDKAYTITVPAFRFIGYDNFTFETLVDDGGVLSAITRDINQQEMANNLITDEVKAQHVADNTQLLQMQCETFYTNIVRSIDPEIELTFVYTDAPSAAPAA